ncbi:hypothetical protein Kpol_339p6 [Vanderwaltozyma polyspora DSM 70294]|uniref:RING-type E3 ubiquitin transferase n=1 Tax=Vanderwaltozyma polyspora (strain ATCC 22028 / DSM 70294 / BCRC 21397 / CBS 2163 / NBRC 10782 / NRRL Y-8283 / UCD 57-17) TaxID=436907 RepID=A7TSD4_VANPO|nr:uncharacterized protein Kpol_339p6 [Vanderwaltozyma polyspora DSM 70294]EDO14819.1 hypothetical protein Kpol_339p6 [Vanderwaltozyma polyspora DSM 70294]
MTEDLQYINGFAHWQPDEDIRNCLNCSTKFSFLIRKHHCRSCGGIFCASCSDYFVRYDTDRVKVVKRWPAEEEYAPYRTCDSCYKNLLGLGLLKGRYRNSLNNVDSNSSTEDVDDTNEIPDPIQSEESSVRISEEVVDTNKNNRNQNENTTVRDNNNDIVDGDGVSDTVRQDYSEESHCPICNLYLVDFKLESDATKHVEICVENAANMQQHLSSAESTENTPSNHKSRMLVYQIPESEGSNDENVEYAECPICFEDMVPGDKVGRLECLCVFHYNCIKSWFKKKSKQMKTKDPKAVLKNFCPLHDAVF